MSDFSPPVWKNEGNLGKLLTAAAWSRASSLRTMNEGLEGVADAFKDYDKSKGEERLGLAQSAMMDAPDQASLQEFFSQASKASPGNTDALYKTLTTAQERIKQNRMQGVMSGDIDPTSADLGSAGNEYQRNTIANRIAGNRLSGYAYPERGNTLVDQQANISALRNSDIYQQSNPLVQTAMESRYSNRQNIDSSFFGGSPEAAQQKMEVIARGRAGEARAAARHASMNKQRNLAISKQADAAAYENQFFGGGRTGQPESSGDMINRIKAAQMPVPVPVQTGGNGDLLQQYISGSPVGSSFGSEGIGMPAVQDLPGGAPVTPGGQAAPDLEPTQMTSVEPGRYIPLYSHKRSQSASGAKRVNAKVSREVSPIVSQNFQFSGVDSYVSALQFRESQVQDLVQGGVPAENAEEIVNSHLKGRGYDLRGINTPEDIRIADAKRIQKSSDQRKKTFIPIRNDAGAVDIGATDAAFARGDYGETTVSEYNQSTFPDRIRADAGDLKSMPGLVSINSDLRKLFEDLDSSLQDGNFSQVEAIRGKIKPLMKTLEQGESIIFDAEEYQGLTAGQKKNGQQLYRNESGYTAYEKRLEKLESGFTRSRKAYQKKLQTQVASEKKEYNVLRHPELKTAVKDVKNITRRVLTLEPKLAGNEHLVNMGILALGEYDKELLGGNRFILGADGDKRIVNWIREYVSNNPKKYSTLFASLRED